MSTIDLKDLDPDSPDYAAAEEAALRAEDEAHGAGAVQQYDDGQPAAAETPLDQPVDEAPKPADDAAAPPVEASAAAVPEKAAKPAGVLSKDGTRVLPYAALKGARDETRSERDARITAEARAADLERQLEDIKAGRQAPSVPSKLTDEYIARVEVDFPDMGVALRALKNTQDELEAIRGSGKSAAAPAQAPASDQGDEDSLQTAIDSVPSLAAWQGEKGPEWKRAIELDVVFEKSPKWKGKPLEARLAHVASIVADEFDIQADLGGHDTPSPQQPNKQPTTPARKPPAEVIKEAARTAPNTLSDFKGGATDPTRDNFDRMAPTRQMTRFEDMTDAEIEAHLAKVG